ncbi:DUF502 domain-containing protein [Methylomonas sp. 11b]|uniref:DUF502 domain-containing protein n=1 Tax=Methylomonas sp. 11b TaxID=1168169 RepID=UPI00047E4CF5|nr:DUF502 domain-containing protein [Methylomonas sp. 11b]
MKSIRRTFIKGLIAIIPLIFTLYLLFWFAGTLEMALGYIFKFIFPDSWYIRGFGVALAIPLVFFFGCFLESRSFRKVFNTFETQVIQIPFIKSIYTTMRDFTSLFSHENKGKFKQVVLVNAPPGNSQQIGFITVSDFEDTSHTFITDDQIAVYIPFSYQVGGQTVIISREHVIGIDMSVEDALRFIATAGIAGSTNNA